ncbi:MAG: DUF202 domain-containing protein [Phycisphaerae bacterium]
MPDSAPVGSGNAQLTLRDHLAIDRTTLANERTLLGYVRTALALVIVSASALKFLSSAAPVVVGWTFLAIGVATVLVGLRRFWQMKRRIEGLPL